ncbi:MAG: glycosyltransferase family 4 protein [Candidatus Dormibacteraeota bacterium]|nr:glycosyltransferase family 4 protein [Candidatus Dormibacteraeota bacterium]
MAKAVAFAGGDGVTVEIISPAPQAAVRSLGPGVTLRGVPMSPAGAAYGEGVSWEFVAALESADLIHVHQVFTRMGEAAAIAGRMRGVPVCITDHGGGTRTVGRRLGLVDMVDAAIAYSRCGATALGDSANVTVIEGGVDAEFFHDTSASGVRDRFLFVGRIMPHKGVDLLLRALPDDAPLTVAGTVADATYLELLHELARGHDVSFATNPNDVELRDLYSSAIAIVQPSVHIDVYGRVYQYPELMGLVALEGMACGAPAVVLRTGALPEYVDDGLTGFVVDNEAQLRDRLELLAADPELCAAMGRAARERVLTLWDSRIAGERMLRLYRRLAEN